MAEFLSIMLTPFLACLVLVGIHVYFGLHVLAREIIFVDLALAQVAALGSTFGFLAGYAPGSTSAYLFSLGTTFLAAGVFSVTRTEKARIPQEAIIGIVFAVASAASILAVARAAHGAEQIKDLLVGSILWVTWPKVIQMAVIYTAVGAFHWIFRRVFLRISFDKNPDGMSKRRLILWDFLFYASFGLVVTSSVSIAGVLPVFSFLIVPAVCAVLACRSITARLITGWLMGIGTSALGISFSYAWDLPTGATIVCAFGVVLIAWALSVTALRRRKQGIMTA